MDGTVNAAAPTVVTYARLHRVAGEKKQNAARNRAFLGRLRRFADRGEDADAGADLANPKLIDDFLGSLRDEKGFHNRTSALNQLREYAASCAEDYSLQAVLTHALTVAGCTAWVAGRIAFPDKVGETSNAWITRYLRGKSLPSEKARAGLVRLEQHLRLAEGTLTRFIGGSKGGAWKLPRLFDLNNPLYSFDPERTARSTLPDGVLRELELYFEFKTRPTPMVELPGGGLKRLKRRTKYTETKDGVSYVGERSRLARKWHSFPSCVIVQNAVRSIYTHAVVERGLQDLDSLVILANADLIEDFISSEVQRRGEYNGFHGYVVNLCATLLNETAGFIAQLPEVFFEAYSRHVDPKVTPTGWLASIKRQHEEIKDIPRRLKPNVPANMRVQMTRQKKRKLQKLLEMERFYRRVVFPTVRYLEEHRPLPSAPEGMRISYELDLLILVCFAACPLRLLNWAKAEWGRNLVREDTGWRMIVPYQEIKNRRWLEEDFDVDLPSWCTPHLDRYHREVRPLVRLQRPKAPDLVMLPSDVNSRATRPAVSGVYKVVNHRMVHLTGALWNVRVSPHDWRDIYGTDYMHEHPEGALVLAMMLNDKVETILTRYAKPSYRRMSRVANRYFDEAYSSGRHDKLLPGRAHTRTDGADNGKGSARLRAKAKAPSSKARR
jgi:hypothetical protein